jgi:hypothetical protein
MEDMGLIAGSVVKIFSPHSYGDLPNGYVGKGVQNMKLSTHLHAVPKMRMYKTLLTLLYKLLYAYVARYKILG